MYCTLEELVSCSTILPNPVWLQLLYLLQTLVEELLNKTTMWWLTENILGKKKVAELKTTYVIVILRVTLETQESMAAKVRKGKLGVPEPQA